MTRARLVVIVAFLLVAGPRSASAYSVLAHEAMIDALWEDVLAPALRQRYPALTADTLQRARAFAYGGSVIQDLGFYPFGNRLFSHLTHYVRSGDFVASLLREAQDADQFAFALGALAHYAADNEGHPIATNRAVPLMYPKLRLKHGDEVTFAEDPRRHVMVEFGFDVVQAASGAYLPDAYRAFIGFEVARPVLERAFLATYGVELKDMFLDTDLAIGSYRYAISQTIPEMTRVAWKDKQDEILKVSPGVQRDAFVYSQTRQNYEKSFGTDYRKPGWLARFLGLLVRILPKIGPLSALAFRVPTPEAERLFAESFRAARERYRTLLSDARDGAIDLANTDFDTGQPATWGEYPLADETYVDLLDTLAQRKFSDVPDDLRQDITRFFGLVAAPAPGDKKMVKRVTVIRQQLAALNSAP